MAITYNNLYLDVRQQFRQAEIAAATLEARELVCFASNKNREELIRDGWLYAPPEVEAAVRDLVARHLAGEPVAYLVGEWDFYGLTIDVDEQVLIPRIDTEVLVEQALQYIDALGECRVLDLCAGSGCIGLAIANRAKQSRVLLGELSEGARHVCRRNIRRCGLGSRVTVTEVDALQKPAPSLGEFHCIVSNPPYIPSRDIADLDGSVRDYEPHMALDGGEDGLMFYRAICQLWKRSLKIGGRLYVEVGIGQADEVLRMMRSHGFGHLEIVTDSGGVPRVVYGTLLSEI